MRDINVKKMLIENSVVALLAIVIQQSFCLFGYKMYQGKGFIIVHLMIYLIEISILQSKILLYMYIASAAVHAPITGVYP